MTKRLAKGLSKRPGCKLKAVMADLNLKLRRTRGVFLTSQRASQGFSVPASRCCFSRPHRKKGGEWRE